MKAANAPRGAAPVSREIAACDAALRYPRNEGKPDLSIVIPAYNEAENLRSLAEKLVHALEDLSQSWEILLVNDGSTDNSGYILDKIASANRRFKIVHLRRNFGQTASRMAALDHSRGDVIVMMDSDLQNDLGDIVRLVHELEERYDVVPVDARIVAMRSGNLPSRLANRLISRVSEGVLRCGEQSRGSLMRPNFFTAVAKEDTLLSQARLSTQKIIEGMRISPVE